jgi:hypothetical protein
MNQGAFKLWVHWIQLVQPHQRQRAAVAAAGVRLRGREAPRRGRCALLRRRTPQQRAAMECCYDHHPHGRGSSSSSCSRTATMLVRGCGRNGVLPPPLVAAAAAPPGDAADDALNVDGHPWKSFWLSQQRFLNIFADSERRKERSHPLAIRYAARCRCQRVVLHEAAPPRVGCCVLTSRVASPQSAFL